MTPWPPAGDHRGGKTTEKTFYSCFKWDHLPSNRSDSQPLLEVFADVWNHFCLHCEWTRLQSMMISVLNHSQTTITSLRGCWFALWLVGPASVWATNEPSETFVPLRLFDWQLLHQQRQQEFNPAEFISAKQSSLNEFGGGGGVKLSPTIFWNFQLRFLDGSSSCLTLSCFL